MKKIYQVKPHKNDIYMYGKKNLLSKRFEIKKIICSIIDSNYKNFCKILINL